jgi:hypothetical protein
MGDGKKSGISLLARRVGGPTEQAMKGGSFKRKEYDFGVLEAARSRGRRAYHITLRAKRTALEEMSGAPARILVASGSRGSTDEAVYFFAKHLRMRASLHEVRWLKAIVSRFLSETGWFDVARVDWPWDNGADAGYQELRGHP